MVLVYHTVCACPHLGSMQPPCPAVCPDAKRAPRPSSMQRITHASLSAVVRVP
jgi:hypothetical protein